MVHCGLRILLCASNNKKGWIVSFLALPSTPDVKYCCFLSFLILAISPLFWSLYSVSVSCPSRCLSQLLLYSFTLGSLFLSLTLVVTFLVPLCAVTSSAAWVFLPPAPPPALPFCCHGGLIARSLTGRGPQLQHLHNLSTSNVFFLTCLIWWAAILGFFL